MATAATHPASAESPTHTATAATANGRDRASDMATPEHIAQLTHQLSTLLTDTVEHIAGLNREARILALNAEIESARAGDAGVAFGVVAKAMSQLSEKNRRLGEGTGPRLQGPDSGNAAGDRGFADQDARRAAVGYGAHEHRPRRSQPVRAVVRRALVGDRRQRRLGARVAVDFLATGDWSAYRRFTLEPGKPFTHTFPAGYAAHWVRLVSDRDCVATAEFTYE